MMECHQCHADNPDGMKYCGNCGAQLSAPTLRQEIDAAIKEQLKDQKVVEIELTEAIVSRLTGWAKMLAYLVGIPLVLLGGALGFLGVKTWLDFSALSHKAASQAADFEQRSKSLTAQLDELRKKSDDLKSGFSDIDKQLAETRALSSRVEGLAKEVRQIREKVGFEKSSALTPRLQKELEASFYGFQAYLEKTGYKSKKGIIKLRVDPALKSNTTYDGERIVLGENIAADRHALLYTYMMHVLKETKASSWDLPYATTAGAVASALGDYFSASFLDDPRISPVLAKESGLKEPYIRNLENQKRFDDHSLAGWDEVHSRGETWGGAFWELRRLLGQEVADRLLFRAWVEWVPAQDADESFVRTLASLSPSVDRVREIFARRGLKVAGK